MDGFTLSEILADQLTLVPAENHLFLWIFVLIGLAGVGLFAVCRLKWLKSVPAHLHSVFLGFGMIFFSGGFLFMFSDTPERLIFDKTRHEIRIEEKSGGEILTTVIPFAEIDSLIVSPRLLLPVSQENIRPEEQSSGLYIRLHDGSRYLLSHSTVKDDTKEMAGKISVFSGLPLIISTPERAESPSGKMTCDTTASGKITQNTLILLTWDEYRSWLQIGFLLLLIAGFNFLIFNSPISFRLRHLVAKVFIIVIDLIFASILIFRLAGNHSFEISESSIRYRQNFAHILLSELSMPLNDVAYARSGLVPGEPGMLIISRTGVEIMDDLISRFPKDKEPGLAEALVLFPMMQRLTNEIIQIDPQTMPFHDRFKIDRVLNGIPNARRSETWNRP